MNARVGEARLVLEDGSVFNGLSCGANEKVSGEVVFNTGMVGYPQGFTDPSYKGQILTLTYPLVGNYGVPLKDLESSQVQILGLVVSECSSSHSHWASQKSLSEWLKESRVPAIQGVDTRALTKKLREKGVMLGCILFDEKEEPRFDDPNSRNLVAEVSIKHPVVYEDSIENPSSLEKQGGAGGKKTVVLVDTGVKNNIIRNLLQRNLRVIRVPWDYDFLELEFDGVMLSNGPGDPKMCGETIKNVRKAMDARFPIMGVCLGNQLLALAAGGNTYKLKYGHRGQNQPAVLEGSKNCFVTSQNHGFAVDVSSLPGDWKPLFTNANDNTNEGIIHESGLFFYSQFHPEAAPGPNDANFLFDKFVKLLDEKRERK